jgi:DNA-binding SARP family transcriptional activator/predicted ATPase
MLAFTLLDHVEVSKDGEPLSHFRSQKEIALLIYLAQTGDIHSREFLAELLWENSNKKQALTNLRTTLARLRKQIGEALVVTRQTLALAPECRQQVDSVVLLQTLSRIRQVDSPKKATALQNALKTYRGDFLADFQLDNAPQFDDWVSLTREYIRSQVIAAYEKLGQYAQATGDTENGIAIARRWLEVDELDEAAHTLLIQLQVQQGNLNQAVDQYTQVADLLRTELDVEPSPEMTALIEQARPKPLKPTVTMPPPVAMVRHNLPAFYNQFFGRETSQAEIHARLDQPWCRLVTIAGQGGVGKTRLATTIAHTRRHHYPDGVWLVELADMDADDPDLAEAIAIEIATSLDLRLTGSAKPADQLLKHLQHKRMLLVLDNFEHLLAGIQIVLDIIEQTEKIQVLVTSRESLGVRAEWTIELEGLNYPTDNADETASDAVALFIARQAQQKRGTNSAADLTAIRDICHMVEGLPLAIELAATLTRRTSCRAIADQLHQDFDMLATAVRDVPDRHRSLQIVFEMSWDTLTPALQLRLARLARFRGGFTATAAQQVAEADLNQLAALCDKSLLAYDAESDRYNFHAVVREYAGKKRPPTDPAPQKHAHHYLALLAQHSDPLQKATPQHSIALIKPDIDNVRLAWQFALEQRQVDWLTPALTPLSIYYQLRGLAHEAEATMQTTWHTAKSWGNTALPLATRAGIEQARFQIRLGQYLPAIHTVKTALKLARKSDDRWAESMGQILWGEALWRTGKYDIATQKLTHALDIAHTLNATLLVGWCHHHLGVINDIQCRYDTAHDHLQQACNAWRTINNAQALSNSLNSIGLVRYHQGDLPAAQQAMEQALTICNQIVNRYLQSALLNNLSIISTQQDDHMGAQYYLQLALELANATGNLAGQGDIFTNLGRNYHQLQESSLAFDSLEQGLRIAKLINNRSLQAITMNSLADVKANQGMLEQAKSLYLQALNIAQKNNLQRSEFNSLVGIAELLSKNDVEQALQYSIKAIDLAKALQNLQWLKRASAIHAFLSVSVDINE